MKRIIVFCLVAWVGLAACAAPNGEPRPPTIAYGLDLCEACGMLIDDPRLAAATLDTNGVTHKFDDIGDMLAYHAATPTAQVAAWFVHDYQTEAWVRAEGAYFVFSPDLATPMGHGLAAFEQEADAQALAAQWETSVISFDEARAAMHGMAHSDH